MAHFLFMTNDNANPPKPLQQNDFQKEQVSFFKGISYFFRGFLIAACAAASRAIGTRKGEQDT